MVNLIEFTEFDYSNFVINANHCFFSILATTFQYLPLFLFTTMYAILHTQFGTFKAALRYCTLTISRFYVDFTMRYLLASYLIPVMYIALVINLSFIKTFLSKQELLLPQSLVSTLQWPCNIDLCIHLQLNMNENKVL